MFHKFAFGLMLCAMLGALLMLSPRVARADSVITNCSNDSQLTTALASGGTITFNCGTATITFSGQKAINVNTTIDGGGKISFSGGNSTRLFWVNSGKALTLKNLVLANGSAGSSYGGCIYVDGSTLTVQNSTIQNCTTTNYAGGAIVSPNGNVTLDRVIMKNNSGSSGGALSATGSVTIRSSQFINNTGSDGGGALSLAATAVIQQSTFTGNKSRVSNGYGGAIYANGNVTIYAGVFNTNEANAGGAIYVEKNSSLTLDASLVESNDGATHTGGIYNDGTLIVTDSAIRNNTATFHAGGIRNNGTATLTNVTLSGNDSGNFGAGGLSNGGTATLNKVTISGNTTGGYGGGLSNSSTANANLTNVTLSSNSSQEAGGGIINYGSLNLLNVTLNNNSAVNGGSGIYKSSGAVTVKNTLIANGAGSTNCNTLLGGSFNLSDDFGCGFGAGRDNVTLALGPLSFNGSSTQTHLPLPGSFAIDNGTLIGAPATDQRGNNRPQNVSIDVGAVEVCTVKPDKPSLASPLNNAKYKGTQVALDWDDTPCADKYKITVKDAATGTKVQGGKSNTSDFKTKALTKGKTYKWFAQACNTIGCTKSDTWKFTVK